MLTRMSATRIRKRTHRNWKAQNRKEKPLLGVHSFFIIRAKFVKQNFMNTIWTVALSCSYVHMIICVHSHGVHLTNAAEKFRWNKNGEKMIVLKPKTKQGTDCIQHSNANRFPSSQIHQLFCVNSKHHFKIRAVVYTRNFDSAHCIQYRNVDLKDELVPPPLSFSTKKNINSAEHCCYFSRV